MKQAIKRLAIITIVAFVAQSCELGDATTIAGESESTQQLTTTTRSDSQAE